MTSDVDTLLLRLIHAHPLLFRGRQPTIDSYVPEGWYSLIDRLCLSIVESLGTDGCAQFKVVQIKEKYGTLRFYYRLNGQDDRHFDAVSSIGRVHATGRPTEATLGGETVESRIRALVAAASEASEAVCEMCGAQAQLHDVSGYLAVRCRVHLAELAAQRAMRQIKGSH